MLFYQVFLFSPVQSQYRTEEIVRGCVSLKKNKSQGRRSRGVEVTVNSKEENF